jgi:hypothetical protein
MFSGRIYSPSPTVRSSRVPLYLRGVGLGLGQDPSAVDLTPPEIFAPGVPAIDYSPGIFSPVDPTLQPLLDQGFTADEADMINAAAANGVITDAQFQSILAGSHSYQEIANTIFGTSVMPQGPQQGSPVAASSAQVASAAAKAAGQVSAGTAAAQVAAAAAKLAPGASPRVATSVPGSMTSLLTKASVIPGVPNVLLIAAGALFLFAAGGKR